MSEYCDIYYNSTEVLVCAVHAGASHMTPAGEPLTLISRNDPTASIGEAVLRSLHGCRTGLSEAEISLQMSRVLEAAREKTWKDFLKKWDLIGVHSEIQKGIATFYPMHRCQKGSYLSEIDDPIYHCSVEVNEIERTVKSIINGPPFAVIPVRPSHT